MVLLTRSQFTALPGRPGTRHGRQRKARTPHSSTCCSTMDITAVFAEMMSAIEMVRADSGSKGGAAPLLMVARRATSPLVPHDWLRDGSS